MKLRYFASSCAKVATENSTSGSSLGTFSSSQRRSRGRRTNHVPSQRVPIFGVPFYVISHAWHVWRAAFLAEPGQTPHITTWVYGCRRLFRCGCAGAVRREGYVVEARGRSCWGTAGAHRSKQRSYVRLGRNTGPKATRHPAWECWRTGKLKSTESPCLNQCN